AEVLASAFLWSATHTDAPWELGFWRFEASRLGYWSILMCLSIAVLAVCRSGLRLYWVRRECTHAARPVLIALCGLLAMATECLTSLYLWNNERFSSPVFIGWPYRSQYVADHFV